MPLSQQTPPLRPNKPDSSIRIIFEPLVEFSLPPGPIVAVILFEEKFENVFGFAGFWMIGIAGEVEEQRELDGIRPIQHVFGEDVEHGLRQGGIRQKLAKGRIIFIRSEI